MEKIYFVEWEKCCNFAASFNRKKDREKARFLYSAIGETWTLSRRNNVGMRQMISHLCCILLLSVYAKWSYISKPYLHCSKTKGVQALPIEIRGMDGSTFFV